MNADNENFFGITEINRLFRMTIPEDGVSNLPNMAEDEIGFYYAAGLSIRVYESGTSGSKHGGCIPKAGLLEMPASGLVS